MRSIVDRTLQQDGDARYFKPRQCQNNALEGVGILGRLPSIAANVVVSNQEGKALAMHLSKLTRALSHKKHMDFINGK